MTDQADKEFLYEVLICYGPEFDSVIVSAEHWEQMRRLLIVGQPHQLIAWVKPNDLGDDMLFITAKGMELLNDK